MNNSSFLFVAAIVLLAGASSCDAAAEVRPPKDSIHRNVQENSSSSSSSSGCPFAKKVDKPMANNEDFPKCTTAAESPGFITDRIAQRQLLFNDYCDHYGFTSDGATDGDPVCITILDQAVPDDLRARCAGVHENSCFGPLEQLIGRWEGTGQAFTWVPEYDPSSLGRADISLPMGVGRVPEQPMTNAHSFFKTYKEIMVFKPIKGDVRNRGVADADPVNAKCRDDQSFHGLLYELKIVQTSPTDHDGEIDGVIHEENGMYMFNTIPASAGGTGYTVNKLFSVPHGITVSAIGNHSTYEDTDDVQCELMAQQRGVDLSNMPEPQGFCFPDAFYIADIPEAPMENNRFLVNETEQMSDPQSFLHIRLESQNELAQSPFVKEQVNNKNYQFDLWVTKDTNGDMTLQYGQKVLWEFMARLECLDCEGVTEVDSNSNGCMTRCAGMDRYILNGTYPNGTEIDFAAGLGEADAEVLVPGKNFNEMDTFQHGQCYNCKLNTSDARGTENGRESCAQQPLLEWPHTQTGTLKKVSDDYQTSIFADDEETNGDSDGTTSTEESDGEGASSRSLRQASTEAWSTQVIGTITGLIFAAASYFLSS